MLPRDTSWWTSSIGSPAIVRSSCAASSPSAVSAINRPVDRGSRRLPSRPARRTASSGSPFEVLHRDEVAAAGLPEVVDIDHVRVLEHRRHPGLVEQHVDERLLGREVLVDELDDHQLLEPRGAALDGELHLRHPTLADLGDQLVPPQRSHQKSVTQRAFTRR